MKFGLLAKFAVSVSLVVIFSTVVLSIFHVQTERFRAEAELKNKGYSLARNLAYNSEYGILSGNIEALSRLVKSLMEEEDVVYVQILDDKGNILAKDQKARVEAEIFNVETPVKSVEFKRTAEEIGIEPLAPPKKSAKEKMIGNVKLGISLARAGIVVSQLLGIIWGLTLAVVLAGVFGVVLLTRYLLIYPLRQFIVRTNKIAQGDLSRKIEIKSRDEIGELASSFNTMTEELAKARDKLAGYTLELEKKVAERTKELENTVAELKKTAAELEIAKTGLEKKVAERTGEVEREKASLEEKVGERTAELQKKVTELQEFYDLTVGRELKMMELEKEIDALRQEPGREEK